MRLNTEFFHVYFASKYHPRRSLSCFRLEQSPKARPSEAVDSEATLFIQII